MTRLSGILEQKEQVNFEFKNLDGMTVDLILKPPEYYCQFLLLTKNYLLGFLCVHFLCWYSTDFISVVPVLLSVSLINRNPSFFEGLDGLLLYLP